jgi:hypothetical protein
LKASLGALASMPLLLPLHRLEFSPKLSRPASIAGVVCLCELLLCHRFGPSSSDVGVAIVVCQRRCLAVLDHRTRDWLHLGQLLPSV